MGTAMRLAIVWVSPTFVLGMLGGHPMSRVETNLPADARVLGAFIDQARNQIGLRVESASFDDIPEACIIPDFNLIATKSIDELTVIADLVSQKPCWKCGASREDS